jgi:acetyl esterase/lipase
VADDEVAEQPEVDWMTAPFVLDTAGMRAVTVQRDIDYHGGDPGLRMDVYRPVGTGPWPVVLFVHGEGSDPEAVPRIKSTPLYSGWGRLVASLGMVGVTFTPRSWERLRHVARKVADVEAAVRFVRSRGHTWGADTSRLAVWSGSGGVPVGVSVAAREGAACAVAYYGVMDLRPYGDDPRLADASPMALVESDASIPPLLIVRCGQDAPELNESIDAFTNAAWERDLPVELLAYEEGHHAFEVVDHAAESRDVIRQTVEFLQEHLGVG